MRTTMNELVKIEEPKLTLTASRPNRSRVVSRKVTRYFVYGHGYSRRIDAYSAIAKHELRVTLCRKARSLVDTYLEENGLTPRDLTLAAWTELNDRMEVMAKAWFFPNTCTKTNEGIGLTTFWHGKRPGVYGVFWCNGCKWDWIRTRAKELMRADDEGEGQAN